MSVTNALDENAQPNPGYPRSFGQYLLLAPLAQGGMGEVFLGTTGGSSGAVRLVVIKTLRPDLVDEQGYVQRFFDEARIVIQLHHQYISQVFDAGTVDGIHYIAMEHIAGKNLRRLVEAADHIIPTPVALLIAADMLEGLDAAHRHRHPLTREPLHVVHRDVSPHNVMVSYDGDVKIIDFGLADSDIKLEQTGSNVVLGKIAYMSPEQARGDKVDARSDQYSAAIVLYELLAGDRFYGNLEHHQIWQIAGATAHKPAALAALTPLLGAILTRALSFNPADRFESCAEFATALRVFLKERFPLAERSTLRDFVREHLLEDRMRSELSMRTVAPYALSAISRSNAAAPGTVSPPPPTGETARVLNDAQSIANDDTREENTSTSSAAQLARRTGRRAVLALAAAALVAVVVIMIKIATGDTADLPPAVVPIVPIVPVVESIAPAADPAVENAPAVPPLAPVIDAPVVKDVEPAKSERVKAEPKKKRPKLDDGWTGWPMERKVKALESSSLPCAKVLLRLRNNGTQLQPGAVDSCLAQSHAR